MASLERHGNRFRVLWREGGVKHRRSFGSEPEARAFADTALSTVRLRTIDVPPVVAAMLGRPSSSPAVTEFARPLVDDIGLGSSSRDIYAQALSKIEGTALGRTPLHQVRPSDVRDFMNALTTDRRNVHQFLAKVFNAAVHEDLLTASPLTKGRIRRPAQLQRDLRPLSLDEIARLISGTANEREALCIKIGAFVGLRGGEVGGLRAEDVDVAACKVHVRQNAILTSEGRSIGPLKTKASRRSLTIAPSLMRKIENYLSSHTTNDDHLIFHTPRGYVLTAWELSKCTQRAAARVGLRPVSFHHLRHACASLLIDAGVPAKAIQHYLGHSSIRVTMDIYGHLFPNTDAALATAMEGLLQAQPTRTL